MNYEENMRIGFLGGVKSGKTTESAIDYNADRLRWMIQAETNKPVPIKQAEPQREIFRPGYVEYDEYNLLILKKDDTLKFFYVLKGMGRENIKELLLTHWDNSDILGYDFD